MKADPSPTAPAASQLHFGAKLLRPHQWVMAGATALLLVETAATLSLPLLAGRLTDIFVADSAMTELLLPALALVALLMIQLGGRVASRLVLARIGDHILLELRRRTFAHLQRLPMQQHTSRPRGDRLSLLTTDAHALAAFLASTMPGLAPTLVTLIGALAIMAWIQPLLAALIILVVPPAAFLLRYWMAAIRRRSRAWYDAQAATVSVAEQAIDLLPMIKAEGQERRHDQTYESHARSALDHARDLRLSLVPLQPVVQFVAVTGIIALVLLAVSPWLGASPEPGQLVALALYGVLIARPLSSLANAVARWNGAVGALDRIMETLSLPPESSTGTRHLPNRLARGIAFERVQFGYDPDRPVLKDFCLEIGAGECLALTGANGSGKTTLLWLLLRFYSPQQGSISINGIDIEEYDLHALRRGIALVPQQVWLSDGTLADNIRLGWPQAPDDRVRKSAYMAGLDSLIQGLPDGLNTRLGPRGATLSGGQQQRLALARALIRPTPILALDEATSMFDEIGERQLLERVEPTLRDRTVILITHRPGLLELADRVVNME